MPMKPILIAALALSLSCWGQEHSPILEKSEPPISKPEPTEVEQLRAQVKQLEAKLAAQERVGNIQMGHVIVALNACQQSVHDLLIPPKGQQ